jgi:hypothetical protein
MWLRVRKKEPRARLVITNVPTAKPRIPSELRIRDVDQYFSDFSSGYIFTKDMEFIKIPICISAMVIKINGSKKFN